MDGVHRLYFKQRGRAFRHCQNGWHATPALLKHILEWQGRQNDRTGIGYKGKQRQ